MADVRPFEGLRFDPSAVSDLGSALCGPFDVISPADRSRLLAASDFNAVKLEAPDPLALPDPYSAAAQTLQKWLRNGALRKENAPAYYLVRHRFIHAGKEHTRTEIIGAVGLEPLTADGPVRPHEATRKGPKEDRLKLMGATAANLSPIMLLYSDPGDLTQAVHNAMTSAQIHRAVAGNEESFDLAVLTDPLMLSTIHRALDKCPLYIADGHHRYETALHHATTLNNHKNDNMDSAHNFLMAAIVEMNDPGLLSLPYHRLLRGLDQPSLSRLREQLNQHYEEELFPTKEDPASIAQQALTRLKGTSVVFAAWGLEPGFVSVLSLRDESIISKVASEARQSRSWASLAPSLFRKTLLVPTLRMEEEQAEREGLLSFGKSAVEAATQVLGGHSQVVFMPSPVSMDAFREVANQGERLPPKSTYFHPKLATGLVFRLLEGELARPGL